MSEVFLNKEKDLRNKISLENNTNSIKVIDINEYIDSVHNKFKRIIKEVNNELEAKMLFKDFIELKKNIDEAYLPSSDIDEYTIDKINNANNVLANIYSMILSVSPTIYTSQIQYFAYSSLFNESNWLGFYRCLFEKISSNFEVARYTIGVFKEIIFVHYDLEINNNIIDNITELIELLTKLCDDAGMDVKEELEGLID